MKIKRATLNLIYSFLPVAGDMGYDDNVFKALYKSNKDSCISGKGKLETSELKHENYTVEELDFFNRNGLSSYLSLDLNIGYETEEIIHVNDYSDNFIIKLIPYFRYFSFGSSLTFHVVVEPKVDNSYIAIEEVYALLKIISTERNNASKIRFNINDSLMTIFQFYKLLVTQKLIRANRYYFDLILNDTENPVSEEIKNGKELIIATLEQNQYFIDFLHKNDKKETFNHIRTILSSESQQKAANVNLVNFIIDNCIALLCLKEKHIISNDTKETNIPWLISNLELEESQELDVLCSTHNGLPRYTAIEKKQEEIRKIENNLAPILYRAIDAKFTDYKLEPTYDSFSDVNNVKGLNNMYLDARFYLHMSRRSILTICGNRYEKPANYLIPTLLEICESAHTRWQGLIVLNLILDHNIRNFANHKADRLKPSEKLRIIINLFKKTLSCLENPSSYVISGDSLREINEMLADTYNLKLLEDNTLKKINVLEKVFDLGISLSVL